MPLPYDPERVQQLSLSSPAPRFEPSARRPTSNARPSACPPALRTSPANSAALARAAPKSLAHFECTLRLTRRPALPTPACFERGPTSTAPRLRTPAPPFELPSTPACAALSHAVAPPTSNAHLRTRPALRMHLARPLRTSAPPTSGAPASSNAWAAPTLNANRAPNSRPLRTPVRARSPLDRLRRPTEWLTPHSPPATSRPPPYLRPPRPHYSRLPNSDPLAHSHQSHAARRKYAHPAIPVAHSGFGFGRSLVPRSSHFAPARVAASHAAFSVQLCPPHACPRV
ncbi:hypothetical protein DFH08DRAFT_949501 [Mycena albidolilacea]|uniref:Uncharacterized protein n=1 Tax=Mycena albidolilacea TaxID=1033008 RepID=A0AAD7AP87_9AGAR|nr:hypothetical protein DFH08DRAFT_949501 [Mycena albidolilacea]